jgi:NAD(P)-dependent dehydrogenase (short-subunit alcohol dehydrogenase family)
MEHGSISKTERVWLITGASSGFGRAVTTAALARGDGVAASGLELETIEELVGDCGDRALALPLDVAHANDVRNAVRRAAEHFGRIDVAFNNAGYGHVGSVEELSDADLRRQLDVNLLGNINVTRAVLPYLRRQGSGHLVQMSSLNGVEGLVGAAYYAASKFGIEGFSETLADEVAPFGIKVTIVEPGPFRTRFLSSASVKWAKPMPEYEETVGKARAMLRELDGQQPGDPERAAQAILHAVDAQDPPRRLPLGRMALEHIRARHEAALEELERWTQLAAGADFPLEHTTADQRDRRAAKRHEDLVRRAYSAYNDRAIDAGLELLALDVDWPKVPDGGFVHGREQVGRHWQEQFAAADPHIEIDDVAETSADRVEARVRQTVHDRDGRKVSEDRLLHVFTIANDHIKRLDVSEQSR